MNTYRLNTNLISSLSSILFVPAADMIAQTGIRRATWYNIMDNPSGISIQQLLLIANAMHIPVRRFFSTDAADVIGRRDDYVSEPYQECYYNDDALQDLVNSHNGNTWQKAADTTGMSRSRLRNSLLAVTRTPVERFLTVCRIFGIDPFTILIDPNPEPVKPQKTRGRKQDAPDLRAEIGELRKSVRGLSDTVDDLARKYEALLKAHAALARRVSVNFEHVNGSHINIAAEDLMPPEPDK